MSAENSYLRLAFMVYWMDAYPSGEIFYILQNDAQDFSMTTIGFLEESVVYLIQAADTTKRTIQAVFMGSRPITMTTTDLTQADWHVIL